MPRFLHERKPLKYLPQGPALLRSLSHSVAYLHTFSGPPAEDLAECLICGQHRWYRLHHPDGKPRSREEFFRD